MDAKKQKLDIKGMLYGDITAGRAFRALEDNIKHADLSWDEAPNLKRLIVSAIEYRNSSFKCSLNSEEMKLLKDSGFSCQFSPDDAGEAMYLVSFHPSDTGDISV